MHASGLPPFYDSSSLPYIWPNSQTTLNGSSAAVTLIFKIFDSKRMPLANLPIRVMSVAHAICNKQYYKPAMDVIAFASLFFQYGYLISLGIDVSSEVINRYLNIGPCNAGAILPARLSEDASSSVLANPTIPENAAKILNIPKEKLEDRRFITAQYTRAIEDLQRRQRLPSNELLSRRLQTLINAVKDAYRTLMPEPALD